MNFDDTFGPAKDRLNIVNEDMNDYIYLCIMAKVLRIGTKQYAILPSFGISNFINVCFIYMVRGCRYMAIFNYDVAGVKNGDEQPRKNDV